MATESIGWVRSRTDSGGAEVFSCQLCSMFTGRSFQSVLTHIGEQNCVCVITVDVATAAALILQQLHAYIILQVCSALGF